MIYQVSVTLKDFNYRIPWDRLAETITEELRLDDIVTEKAGSARCKFVFRGEVDTDVLRDRVRNAVMQTLSDGGEKASKAFIVSADRFDSDDLSALKPDTADLLRSKAWFNEAYTPDAPTQDEQVKKHGIPESMEQPEPEEEEEEREQEGSGKQETPVITEHPEEDAPPTLREVTDDVARLRAELMKKVRGQRHAVDEITQGVFESELFARYDENRKGPVTTFLFMGPSGVGKTYLAKEFGKLSGRPVLVVDMSEYSDNLANLKFNGDHGQPAVVTGFVRKHPDAILIFDEIEKAHINTIHLFLQILDAGQLMDMQLRKEVSFRGTTVIMTTNVGSDLYDGTENRNLSDIPRSALINALKSEKKTGQFDRETVFPESITTRMANGHIIMFNHLEPYALLEIVRDEIALQLELFKRSSGITVDFDRVDLPALMLYAGGGAADARTLRGLARNTVIRELQDAALQIKSAGKRDLASVSRVRFTVEIPDESDEVYRLFHQTEGMQALVFTNDASAFSSLSVPYLDIFVTGDTAAFKKRIRGVTDFVLLDPLAGYTAQDERPADVEDIRSDGMEMFEYLREYFPETPIYLLSDAAAPAVDFSTLLSRGARGVLPIGDPAETPEELLKEVSLNALIGNSIYQLGRAGKYLSFNCAQYVSDDGSVEIRFANLRKKTSVNGEDYGSVTQKKEAGNVTFADIVGCKTAKQVLGEFCKALDDPRKGILSGKRLPKGALLYGPPGTGKTMLAKAMVNETKAMFLPVSATSFFGSLVGETEKNIRELFRKARRYAPSVIFIDEVDAIARRRTGSVSSVHNEDALNTLLAEMDGFAVDEKRPVFILAATNYEIDGDGPRVLDQAFVRRFDRKIQIPLPDTDDRRELFARSLARHNIRFAEKHDETLQSMAERSGGMSNADIDMVVEMYARGLKDDEPSAAGLMDTLDEFRFGDVRDHSEEELRQTACHEAGHALVSWVCGVKPLFVTVVSRGGFGGYMAPSSAEKGILTFGELKDRICVCLAGRAAELEVYGDSLGLNTGASSDIRRARNVVRACYNDYAMGGKLLSTTAGQDGETLMQEQFRRARTIITEHRAAFDELVDELVKEKCLDREAVDQIFKKHIASSGS